MSQDITIKGPLSKDHHFCREVNIRVNDEGFDIFAVVKAVQIVCFFTSVALLNGKFVKSELKENWGYNICKIHFDWHKPETVEEKDFCKELLGHLLHNGVIDEEKYWQQLEKL